MRKVFSSADAVGHLAHLFRARRNSAVAGAGAYEETACATAGHHDGTPHPLRLDDRLQWFAVAVVAWRAWAHGFSASQLGLTVHDKSRILIAAVAGAATIAALQWLNLRRVGRIPVEARGSLLAIAERILPQSAVELLPYLALAITAGLCEEFLYRGFVMAVLIHVGLQTWTVVLLSSALFGLAHSYQGRGGIVMTMLIGVILGLGRIAFDSLVPVIFWHSAVDVVAGAVGPRYLTAKANVTQERATPIHQI